MKLTRLLVLVLGIALSSHAQGFVEARRQHPRAGRVWHYINTHKELLASDAIIISGWAADAASTINDEHNCTCVETNPIVGPHPSEHVVWSFAIGSAAMQTAIDHAVWHYPPDPMLRHIVWVPAIIMGLSESFNVYGNVRAAETGYVVRTRILKLSR